MGFEPMTSCLLDRRSSQLSYGASGWLWKIKKNVIGALVYILSIYIFLSLNRFELFIKALCQQIYTIHIQLASRPVKCLLGHA